MDVGFRTELIGFLGYRRMLLSPQCQFATHQRVWRRGGMCFYRLMSPNGQKPASSGNHGDGGKLAGGGEKRLGGDV